MTERLGKKRDLWFTCGLGTGQTERSACTFRQTQFLSSLLPGSLRFCNIISKRKTYILKVLQTKLCVVVAILAHIEEAAGSPVENVK